MTDQLLKVKPSRNNRKNTVAHESAVKSDILYEDKIHPTEDESKQINREIKKPFRQYFRDIATHYQYLLNLNK